MRGGDPAVTDDADVELLHVLKADLIVNMRLRWRALSKQRLVSHECVGCGAAARQMMIN